jgi:hypothetical protein
MYVNIVREKTSKDKSVSVTTGLFTMARVLLLLLSWSLSIFSAYQINGAYSWILSS